MRGRPLLADEAGQSQVAIDYKKFLARSPKDHVETSQSKSCNR